MPRPYAAGNGEVCLGIRTAAVNLLAAGEGLRPYGDPAGVLREAADMSKADTNTAEHNSEVVREFFGAFYAADPAALQKLAHDDFVAHGPGGATADAPAWWALAAELAAAVPDNRTQIDDLVAAGDKVVVRYTTCGTHEGVMHGVAPTGRALTTHGIEIYRVVDGRVAECWGQYDMSELFASGC